MLHVATALKDVLTAEVVTLDEKGSSLMLARAGEDVTTSFPHRLLYNVGTFSTYFVYWGGPDPDGETLQIELRESAGKPPLIRDPLKGRQGTAREFLRDPHTKTSRVNVVPVSDRPLLLDFNGGSDAYVSRAEVTEGVLPSVAEIIARHQEAQAAQDALRDLRRRRAHGAALPPQRHRSRLGRGHGEPVLLRPRGQGVGGADLQPQRVEVGREPPALPAAAAGEGAVPAPRPSPDQGLRYKLEGVEKVGDRECYAVRFEPVEERGRSTGGRCGSTPSPSPS